MPNDNATLMLRRTMEAELRKAAVLYQRASRIATWAFPISVAGIAAAFVIMTWLLDAVSLPVFNLVTMIFFLFLVACIARDQTHLQYLKSLLGLYQTLTPADDDRFDTRNGKIREIARRLTRADTGTADDAPADAATDNRHPK